EEVAVDPASPSSRAGDPVPHGPGLATSPAPPSDPEEEAVAASAPDADEPEEADHEDEPDDAAAATEQAQPAPAAEVRPAPHQPTRGPAPQPGSMGTDVPFMEVKGSALGTD